MYEHWLAPDVMILSSYLFIPMQSSSDHLPTQPPADPFRSAPVSYNIMCTVHSVHVHAVHTVFHMLLLCVLMYYFMFVCM